MNYSYGYMPNYGMQGEEFMALGGLIVLVLAVGILACGFGILCYVFQSVGLHAIGKRRTIRHSWLAWLPIGNMWLLGSISDQYQYVVKGKVRSRRKVLLGLTIAIYALSVPSFLSYLAMLATGFANNAGGGFMVSAVLGGLFSAAISVVTIIAMVFQYIATYDLYASCDPGNAVLYLVLSIIFPVTMPFFLFACRNKDLGMPPRRAPQPAAPAAPEAPAVPAVDAPEVPEEDVPAEDA